MIIKGKKTKMSNMSNVALSSYPIETAKGGKKYLEKNYELAYGEYHNNGFELVLVVDTRNRISFQTLNDLGFNTDNIKNIKFDDIVGTEFKLINNNDFKKI